MSDDIGNSSKFVEEQKFRAASFGRREQKVRFSTFSAVKTSQERCLKFNFLVCLREVRHCEIQKLS